MSVPTAPGFFSEGACDLGEFAELTSRTLRAEEVPNAAHIERNIPIYEGALIAGLPTGTQRRRELLNEWASVLRDRAGVLVIKSAYADTTPIDRATEIYNEIILEERSRNAGSGDHFATAGANDRVWNSLQKLCEKSPEVFALYFGNPVIAAACQAWLGPNYQMTAQVNLVRPGGAAQEAHRDYHLGFQTADATGQYPAHVHDLSPALTLQGAVAHTDMPVESGPTKLLPFSQLYRPGYAAWRRPDFRAHFEEHFVQLALEKGDAVFFNPALFHAAGANVSGNVQRMANLLQVSSAFGRAMESVDRQKMSALLYPALQKLRTEQRLPEDAVDAAIAACAEGYSFPTNLDTDPPVGGLAAETQAVLLRQALDEGLSADAFATALEQQAKRRLP